MAATGGVSGTVTVSGGGPLGGITVCATAVFPAFGSGCDATDASGEYAIESLADATYTVHFGGGGAYADQWYLGKSSSYEAQSVIVAGGLTTEHIDAALQLAAILEGTVTDAETHAAAAEVEVCLRPADNNPTSGTCTTTESNGHYRIAGIAPAEYKLRFNPVYNLGDPDYLTQFYPGAPTFAAGAILHLTAGHSETGIDAEMRSGGRISGTVVNELGEPVKGLSVCTYPVPGKGNESYCIENSAQTATDGTYTLQGVPSGEYKVSFNATGNYLRQYFSDQVTRRAAAAVTVTAPREVTGIDATMHPGGVIAGTLKEAGTSSPIPYGEICASAVGGLNKHCAQAKADGSYRIERLPSAEYQVEFANQDTSTDWPFVPSFYAGSAERAGATPVHVTAGAEVTGIDETVTMGGTISGHITDAVSHEPASGIDVCAFSQGAVVGHCETTHAGGEFKIIGLPTGSYAVRAIPAVGGVEQDFLHGNPRYTTQFYPDASSEGTATPVAAGPGTPASGIDLEMHEGGGIAGTVTGPLDEPLDAVEVCTVETATDLGDRCTSSDASGNYELEGLGAGSYHVDFWQTGPPQLSPQYYDGAQSFAAAQLIEVVGTAVTPGIDAQLFPRGTIEGTVTDAFDGTPIEDAWVCAESGAAFGSVCEYTDSLGRYALPVVPGSYQVKFSYGYYEEQNGAEVEIEEFVTQYFHDAPAPGAATAVTVGSGATITGVDASLTSAAARLDTVSVARAGDGSGAITSSPAGIDCGSSCTGGFETRKTVTLQAEPMAGSTFTGWTGACSGTGSCQIRLTAAANVAATFESTGETTTQSQSPPSTQSTGTGAATTPKPRPRILRCKTGYKLKKVGKTERCVKKPKKHHLRKHPARRH